MTRFMRWRCCECTARLFSSLYKTWRSDARVCLEHCRSLLSSSSALRAAATSRRRSLRSLYRFFFSAKPSSNRCCCWVVAASTLARTKQSFTRCFSPAASCWQRKVNSLRERDSSIRLSFFNTASTAFCHAVASR
ncbi:hypothetical protein DIPPA_00928 [Diplonema papillatum]|nr:hypothetical protein DIPPA_00928 [Diplonema papillatum]